MLFLSELWDYYFTMTVLCSAMAMASDTHRVVVVEMGRAMGSVLPTVKAQKLGMGTAAAQATDAATATA